MDDHRTAQQRLPHQRFRPTPLSAGSRRASALPLGLFGMLAIVMAVELAVAGQGPDLLDPVSFSWQFSAEAARSEATGRDVLCLGDSLAKHTLVPRVIQSGSGRDAYNLAVAAGPVPISYFLFQRALAAGARPKAIVVDFKPSLLAGGPRYRLRQWQQILTPAETLDLIRSTAPSFALELLLGELLPSLRARHEIRENLLAALHSEPAPPRELNAILARNWTVNDGVHLATPRPEFTGDVSEAEHGTLLSDRFAVHRVNAAFARRLVALAASRGIEVYVLIPPFSPALHARRVRSGVEARYDQFVRSLQDRDPSLTVLDARDSGYAASVFVDPTHLDARGAMTISTDVAHVLRRDLENSSITPRRWVPLPSYHVVDMPVALEHFEQSKHAVKVPLKR